MQLILMQKIAQRICTEKPTTSARSSLWRCFTGAFVKSKVWGSDIDMWLCLETSCTLLHAMFTTLLDRGQAEV